MADFQDLTNATSGSVNTTANGLITIPPGMSSMEFFLRSTPGWQFSRGEAGRAVAQSAGARGTLLNRPRTLNALANSYLPGVADQTYGPQVGRYLSLADLGLRGATAPFI